MESTFAVAAIILALISTALAAALWLSARRLATSRGELASIRARLGPLLKYQEIEDATAEAFAIRRKAETFKAETETQAKTLSEEMLREAREAAQTQRAQAEEEAVRVRRLALEQAKSTNERAEEARRAAYSESEKILEHAKEQAQALAGEALEAKGKADQYERAALAMKNLVNGYGDEYLVANRTALDDLAADFGHKEAGAQLALARNYYRQLVKQGRASACSYVEQNRRTSAVQFVLDAFNGKVDTALAKVRHDNFGRIAQEINDGFALVNNLGSAFRDARITEEYLAARLDELKWTVAAHELKIAEREEQRLIKEAMREEERAQREYEKAQKAAQKEEKSILKAMQIAQAELVNAAAEQRIEFEAKLTALRQQLAEAEEKNQRALSMAQQTRRGHVYVISNMGSFGDRVFKIGLTRRLEPLDRVRELGDASVPFPFDVHAMIHSEDAPALERELHRRFSARQVNRVNQRKEFFRVDAKEVRVVVEEMGIIAHWTLTAEAMEYRESLALEAKSAASAV